MTDIAEKLLPAEILAKADFRQNEYAWRIADLPQVIEAARALGLRNIGGQLQIRTPDAIGECDWVQIDACQLIPPVLPWEAQVEMAANVALQDLQMLKAEFNFGKEISEAFPEPVARFIEAGGTLEEAVWFVWYVDTEETA
ncbi:MAG: hypothetical protein QM647_04585 [Asticcacaulis sp.]|uniref:hypothetical protein n=1 Tax=Asticcacaulis sp. TaxID=1872648 RepID=UPI0039E4C441